MRALLALALALASVHTAAGGAWWQPVGAGLSCAAACTRVNKAAWAINGGAASQALCSVVLSNTPYHGAWSRGHALIWRLTRNVELLWPFRAGRHPSWVLLAQVGIARLLGCTH